MRRGSFELSDMIILAIPVDSIARLLPKILDKIRPDTIVIDVGSTKSNIAVMIQSHPNRSQYVSAHPLAGTERSGPSAAVKGLIRGKE